MAYIWQIPSVYRLQCCWIRCVKQWCIEVTKIHSLLIENNLQWASDVNVCIIYFVTNGFQVRECLLVARARICLDMTHRDTVVRASLVAKFQRSRILMKRFRWKIQFFFFFPFTSFLHPSTEDSFFDLIWTKGRTGACWRESEKGRRGEAEKDGGDGVTALHPCHLNKLSSVLLANSSQSPFAIVLF